MSAWSTAKNLIVYHYHHNGAMAKGEEQATGYWKLAKVKQTPRGVVDGTFIFVRLNHGG